MCKEALQIAEKRSERQRKKGKIYPIFLKRSLVFPILLFSSISLHWLLKKAFLSLLAILWNSAFSWVYLSLSPLPFTSLLFQLLASPPQTTTLPSCISFSWGWFWSLPPVQCYEPLSIVLQALCIPNPILCICHFHCIIIRYLIKTIPE